MADPFLLLVISSPSGAGKTTLCRKLLEEFTSLRFSVSTTTRPKRPNEKDGFDYHFVTKQRFQELVDQDAFVEWAEVHGHWYGTSTDQIEVSRANRPGIIFDVDYQGSARIKREYPEAITIFLLPPSMVELERRIKGRGVDSEEQVRLRLANAIKEIEHFESFDYIVVNDEIDKAYDRLRSIILSERCRATYQRQAALGLLGTKRPRKR